MANMKDVNVEPRHYLIIPTDPAQRTFVESVERAAQNHMLGEYKIRLNPHYMTTFSCVYLEAIIGVLSAVTQKSGQADLSINFLDLFIVSSDNRRNDEADKDGNINVRFVPGTIADSIMERDFAPNANPEVWQGSIINEVEKRCSRILSERHKATCDQMYTWTLIAYVYFQFMIRHVKLAAQTAKENGQRSVSFNFLEMVEIHCTIEEEANPENPDLVFTKFNLKFRPGFQAKLLIKNDSATEGDE